jgi:hypothetical protein
MATKVDREGLKKGLAELAVLDESDRKRKFARTVELHRCNPSDVSIDMVIFMSAILGGKDGIAWFKAAIPDNERVAAVTRLQQLNVPQESRDLLLKYLG